MTLSKISKLKTAACLTLVIANAASGALVINESDIANDSYTYSLKQANVGSFLNDVASSSNVKVNNFNVSGETRSSVTLVNGSTVGGFTYKFDFASVGEGYQVDSFSLQEVARREQDGSWNSTDLRNATGYSSYYSIDQGSSWILFSEIAPAKGYLGQTVSKTDAPIQLTNGVTSVWFKVELTSSGPAVGSYTTSAGVQNNGWSGMNWNYTGASTSGGNFFEASFNLSAIPEPTTIGSILFGALVLIASSASRRQRQ